MKKTFLVVMVFAGVFACGAVVGGALTFHFRDSFVEDRGAGRFMADQWRDLGQKLDLTVEQKKKIRPIIRRFSEDQQATRKQFQVSFDRMRDDLDALLTPEQRKAYKEYRAQQWERERERRSKGREGEPRGGMPPGPESSSSSGVQKQSRDRDRRSERPGADERKEPQEPRMESSDGRPQTPPQPAPP
jgi:hypothetical protein